MTVITLRDRKRAEWIREQTGVADILVVLGSLSNAKTEPMVSRSNRMDIKR